MKRYNAINARVAPTDAKIAPSIALQQGGQFRLNRNLLKLMGATIGDGVELFHDEANREWYIAKAKADGIPLRRAKHGGATMHSRIIRDLIQEGAEVTHGRFTVSDAVHMIEGMKCYAILIGSAKVRADKKRAA